MVADPYREQLKEKEEKRVLDYHDSPPCASCVILLVVGVSIHACQSLWVILCFYFEGCFLLCPVSALFPVCLLLSPYYSHLLSVVFTCAPHPHVALPVFVT